MDFRNETLHIMTSATPGQTSKPSRPFNVIQMPSRPSPDGDAIADGFDTQRSNVMIALPCSESTVSQSSPSLGPPVRIERHRGFRVVVLAPSDRIENGPFAYAVRHREHVLHASAVIFSSESAAARAGLALIDDALAAMESEG